MPILHNMRMHQTLLALLILTGCHNASIKEGIKEHKSKSDSCLVYECISGAIVRGDTTERSISLVFTGDEFADGGEHIISILKQQQVSGSFFLTGKFYRNSDFEPLIRSLIDAGHYMGAHSDQHLLYCDWNNRDSLLVTRNQFLKDLEDNYKAMNKYGIQKEKSPLFLPPYEWYNDSISSWTRSMGLKLINYTSGTLSHADYTVPGTPEYKSSEFIYLSIVTFEKNNPSGLNGFILLSHIGTAPERTDKFYLHLEQLIKVLKSEGYTFNRIDEHLQH